jgi:hypothetical protein
LKNRGFCEGIVVRFGSPVDYGSEGCRFNSYWVRH